MSFLPAVVLGRSALHCAAHNENSSVAQLLLAKGAAVNATDGEGRMPLHWAALLGRSSVAELLLAMNATVDAADREGGELGGGNLAFHLGIVDVGSVLDIKVAMKFISSYLTFGECTDEVSQGFGKVIPKPKGSGCLCITLPNRSNCLALCRTQRASFGGRAPAGEGCYSRRTRWRGSRPHISAMSS